MSTCTSSRRRRTRPDPDTHAFAAASDFSDPVPTIEADAEPAVAVYPGEQAVPVPLLDGGEVVILAIKPSLWFVVFRTFRWLAGLGVLALLALQFEHTSPWTATFAQAAGVVAALIAGVTLLQWGARLYVLTNRRIMRVRGVLAVEVFQTPLTNVADATLEVAAHERVCKLGTIHFDIADPPDTVIPWHHIARPQETQKIIQDALRRARNAQARNL